MKRWIVPLLVLMIWGCAPAPTQILPTIVFDSKVATPRPSSGGVTASGVVVPAQEAQLAFSIGGKVAQVNVTLGVPVEAGQVMIALENSVAQREYDQAQRDLAEFTSPLALANAKLAMAEAQQAFNDAQTNYNNYVLDFQKGALLDAKDWLAKASSRYFYLLARRDDSPAGRAQLDQAYAEYIHALQAVQAAEQQYQANHASGVAVAQSTIDILTAQYEVAKAALREAQDYYAMLEGGTVGSGSAGAKLARLLDARNRVAVARAQLAATQIIAPFSGVVTMVHVVAGENVSPGAVLAAMHDLSTLHVETTDFSERDLISVKIGQAVSVFLKPLNQNITGHVRTISPLAEILGGDVVYRVKIDLDSQPDGLRAGMSAEVDFSGK
jgi:multidrug efflux pump subunit AcrA (membrane-fusion protein)